MRFGEDGEIGVLVGFVDGPVTGVDDEVFWEFVAEVVFEGNGDGVAYLGCGGEDVGEDEFCVIDGNKKGQEHGEFFLARMALRM